MLKNTLYFNSWCYYNLFKSNSVFLSKFLAFLKLNNLALRILFVANYYYNYIFICVAPDIIDPILKAVIWFFIIAVINKEYTLCLSVISSSYRSESDTPRSVPNLKFYYFIINGNICYFKINTNFAIIICEIL